MFTVEEMGHLKKAWNANLPALSKKEGLLFLKVRIKNHCKYWFKRMLEKNGKITAAELSEKATRFYEGVIEDWSYTPMLLKVSQVTKLSEELAYELVTDCYKKLKPRIMAQIKKDVAEEALREDSRPELAHTIGEDIY
jgi:hypothetical protein